MSAELEAEIVRYSARNYLATRFASPRCDCGSARFRVLLDDRAGVAIRACARCSAQHGIGDSGDFLAGAELGNCACPCGEEVFELAVGLALYDDGAARWLYLGLRCDWCTLAAVYGDWKNEFDDADGLLARV